MNLDDLEYVVRCGPKLTPSDFDDFVRLVKRGGAVKGEYVRCGLKRPETKAVLAKVSGQVVGVSALKVPKATYRCRIEDKSGEKMPEHIFKFELGYVSVKKDIQHNGLGKELAKKVIDLSDSGLFSTTSNAYMERILCELGFVRTGKSWKSDDDECLHLLIRHEP